MRFFKRNLNGIWGTVELTEEEQEKIKRRHLAYAITLQEEIKKIKKCKDMTELERQNIFLKSCPSLFEMMNDYVDQEIEEKQAAGQ